MFTFASGQTFPGTGTITGITTVSGSGLSGGGASGTLSLKVPSAGITNAMLANSKVTLNASTAGGLTVPGAMTLGDTYTIGLKTCSSGQILQYNGTTWGCATVSGTGTITGVTAGTDLTGGGTSGTVKLNLDTTKVPQLASANTFTGVETFDNQVVFDNEVYILPPSTVTTGLEITSANASGTAIDAFGGTGAEGTGIYASGTTGVYGITSTNFGEGVTGQDASSGGGYGVYGGSTNGFGVYANSASSNGVYAQTAGPTAYGVYSVNTSTTGGGGVYGQGTAYGVYGTTSTNNSSGVYGNDSSTIGGYGVYGNSTNGSGVYGSNQSAGTGVYGTSNAYGVYGVTTWAGGEWTGAVGVYGRDDSPLSPDMGIGVEGFSSNGIAVEGISGAGYAGSFGGAVDVQGQLTATGKDFKIDHPLDPANKYLYHASVESSEMMNIYTGNIVLDEKGTAWITLPDYFEALNRDFRYQLTAIGAPGPNLYIANEITNNRFQIAGGTAGAKVSWQVTGIRQDAYARAHPLIVEVEKTGDERGRYRHPVEHGQPKSLGIGEYRRSKMHLPEPSKPPKQAAQLAPPKLEPPKIPPARQPQPKPAVPAKHVTVSVPDK